MTCAPFGPLIAPVWKTVNPAASFTQDADYNISRVIYKPRMHITIRECGREPKPRVHIVMITDLDPQELLTRLSKTIVQSQHNLHRRGEDRIYNIVYELQLLHGSATNWLNECEILAPLRTAWQDPCETSVADISFINFTETALVEETRFMMTRWTSSNADIARLRVQMQEDHELLQCADDINIMIQSCKKTLDQVAAAYKGLLSDLSHLNANTTDKGYIKATRPLSYLVRIWAFNSMELINKHVCSLIPTTMEPKSKDLAVFELRIARAAAAKAVEIYDLLARARHTKVASSLAGYSRAQFVMVCAYVVLGDTASADAMRARFEYAHGDGVASLQAHHHELNDLVRRVLTLEDQTRSWTARMFHAVSGGREEAMRQ
jgi:hypothetical protein